MPTSSANAHDQAVTGQDIIGSITFVARQSTLCPLSHNVCGAVTLWHSRKSPRATGWLGWRSVLARRACDYLRAGPATAVRLAPTYLQTHLSEDVPS